MRLNKLNITGILMMVFAVILFFTNFLDNAILTITYPFLEGSSEGKSVILFMIMGSLLLLYPLFNEKGAIAKKLPSLKFNNQKYLKFTISVIFLTYIFIIILEIWIRAKFGVSTFTIFVPIDHSASSTSIVHSHILKSVLGYFVSSTGIYVPSHINTGTPIAQYVTPIAFIAVVAFPLAYITGLISLSSRRDIHTVILAFAITTSLIGMLDGGIFSAPALVGLSGLLGSYAIKSSFSPRNLIKPSILICLLIIIRISIGIMGSNADFHEITIINPSDNIDLTSYHVLSVEESNNKMIVKISGDITDKDLLLELIEDLKGKSHGFFISWDIFSWSPSES